MFLCFVFSAARIGGGKNNALLVFIAKKSNEVEGVVLSVSKGRTAVSFEGLFSPEQSDTPLLDMESPKEALNNKRGGERAIQNSFGKSDENEEANIFSACSG